MPLGQMQRVELGATAALKENVYKYLQKQAEYEKPQKKQKVLRGPGKGCRR